MNELVLEKSEEELIEEDIVRLERRGAIFPDEIERAKKWIINAIGSERRVSILDHRFDPFDYQMMIDSGRDVSNIRLRGDKVVRSVHITGLNNRIVDLEHGLTCTIKDVALFLRTGSVIRGGRYTQ